MFPHQALVHLIRQSRLVDLIRECLLEELLLSFLQSGVLELPLARRSMDHSHVERRVKNGVVLGNLSVRVPF